MKRVHLPVCPKPTRRVIENHGDYIVISENGTEYARVFAGRSGNRGKVMIRYASRPQKPEVAREGAFELYGIEVARSLLA